MVCARERGRERERERGRVRRKGGRPGAHSTSCEIPRLPRMEQHAPLGGQGSEPRGRGRRAGRGRDRGWGWWGGVSGELAPRPRGGGGQGEGGWLGAEPSAVQQPGPAAWPSSLVPSAARDPRGWREGGREEGRTTASLAATVKQVIEPRRVQTATYLVVARASRGAARSDVASRRAVAGNV